MTINNKSLPWLLAIFFIALFLRLFKLGEIPPSLHWDETALGYNAYSLLTTGRDEYGNLFPLILKSFGDYKPAFYVYLAAVSETLFGLNEFAVRLPSALFGAFSVALLYGVTRELFSGFKEKEKVALIASAVLAVSPWHYHFSHGAWEVNVLMFFILLGIWFFLKAENKRPSFFVLAALFFGLSFFVYQGAKMLTPLIGFGLVVFFWQKIRLASRKTILVSAVLFAVLALPIFSSAFLNNAGGRLKVMSIFSYPRQPQEALKIASEEGGTSQTLEFNIFHGGFHYFIRGILGRYLNHFSPRFLFFEGDWSNLRHSVPLAGQMNHLGILLLPLGAYFLISRKIKNQAFLWYFLLIAPLPAALSRDIIQATRSYFLVFPLTVISAFGVCLLWEQIKKTGGLIKYGLILGGVTVYLFSFIFYLDQFFVHAPKAYSADWLYGYKQAVEYIADKQDDYEKIVFTQKYGQPYIYYLFYTQYDPRKYQSQAKLIESPEGDVGTVEKIDKIEFRDIYWPEDRFIKNRLYIGNQYELPEKDIVSTESRLLGKIYFLNGETAFHIVETLK